MESNDAPQTVSGFPELSGLGKCIELLRIERGISKQTLARHAAASRQQLWRVMTGKSELTTSLCERLAQALRTDIQVLRAAAGGSVITHEVPAEPFPAPRLAAFADPAADSAAVPLPLADYLGDAANVARTLGTYPGGEPGRRLMRGFLDSLGTVAAEQGLALPAGVDELRAALTPTLES